MTQENISSAPTSIITPHALAATIAIFDIKDIQKAKGVFDQVIRGICKGNNIKMNNELMRNIDRSFCLMRSSKPTDDKEKIGIASAILFKILGTDKIIQQRSPDQKGWVKLIASSNKYRHEIQNN